MFNRSKAFRVAAKINSSFIDKMVKDVNVFQHEQYDPPSFETPKYDPFHQPVHPKMLPTSEFNMDKVKSTLKQFVREWSEEGKEEREQCFGPILEELQRYYPVTKENEYTIKVGKILFFFFVLNCLLGCESWVWSWTTTL